MTVSSHHPLLPTHRSKQPIQIINPLSTHKHHLRLDLYPPLRWHLLTPIALLASPKNPHLHTHRPTPSLHLLQPREHPRTLLPPTPPQDPLPAATSPDTLLTDIQPRTAARIIRQLGPEIRDALPAAREDRDKGPEGGQAGADDGNGWFNVSPDPRVDVVPGEVCFADAGEDDEADDGDDDDEAGDGEDEGEYEFLVEGCAEAPEEGDWLSIVLALRFLLLTHLRRSRTWTYHGEDDEVKDDVHRSAGDEEVIDIDTVTRHTDVPEGTDRGAVASYSQATQRRWATHTIGKDRQNRRKLRSM